MKRNKAAAVTQPALRGLGHLLSFFDPRYVCTSGAAQVLNEANLFHEGLHGFFLFADDPFLEGAFGTGNPSENISYYVEDNALGGGPHYNVSSGGEYSCPN
jgi:hypothetical protein